MDLRQSEKYACYMESLGWIVEKIGKTNVFIKKILFFSVIKVQRFDGLDLEKLKILAKKYRTILVKLEPLIARLHPAKPDSWPLLPTKTIVLDLENINLPKDTRYEIRKAEGNRLFTKIASQEQLLRDQFIKCWHQHAKNKNFWIPMYREIRNLATAFEKDYYLFLTHLPSDRSTSVLNSIAGALIIINNNCAHYMYAFSTPEGRKVSAPYLVMWEIIKFCQKMGLKYLDLEGIYDERFPKNNKSWMGFTKFKMGWGGKIVEYPGSFTKHFLFQIVPLSIPGLLLL